MKKLVYLLLVVFSLIIFGSCLAANYPEKPINYVIPFAPGGESDFAAKFQQKYLESILGQKIEIKYRPGSGGALGWSELAKAQPDGYTLTVCNLPHIIVQPLEKPEIGYKTEDINIVYLFNSTPSVLVVAKDSPFKNLRDLIKYAKANPSIVTIGGSGTNTADNLGVIELGKASGSKFTYVPYSGSALAVSALLKHGISALMTSSTTSVTYSKDLKVLAVASEKRLDYLPNVPTFKEQGYKIVEGVYRGIAVPTGNPADKIAKLEAAFDKINRDPEFKKEMENLGFKLEFFGVKESKKIVAEKAKHYQTLLKDLGMGKK